MGSAWYWMVGQHQGNKHTTSQSFSQLKYDVFHSEAISSQEGNINTYIGVVPEVLILQVDKMLRVAQSVHILLCDPLNASITVEVICMLGNGTGHLHHS